MLTTNVGGSFLHVDSRDNMRAWARTALERRPVAVFAQEVPDDAWLEVWTGAGYTSFRGPDKGWKTWSALLIREDLAAEPHVIPNANYHGSYLAAASLALSDGLHVTLCSVHASPNIAEPARYGWPADVVVQPRNGGGDPRYTPDTLWDSDLVLSTLGTMAQTGPLIAAGDFNEAVAYDLDPKSGHVGSWGREYFQRAADLGLTDALSTAWREERATRGVLQLDQCMVNREAAVLLASGQPELDRLWPERADGLSDHTPVWIPLNPEYWPA